MKTPSLYLSRYTEDGALRFQVIYQGCALMASTVDSAKALRFLEETAKKLGLALILYDGDFNEFKALDDYQHGDCPLCR